MEILKLLNEWWESGGISKEKAREYKRKVFESVKKTFFNYRQILLLNGLRRTGKTTIIYQLVEELLKRNVNPKNILYFSFDEGVEDPIKILEEYSKLTKVDWRKEQCFVFFDENQKLKAWSAKIKLLYDNFPNLKICLSGSASLMLEKAAIRDLAGRYFLEYISPLTFQEFAELYFGKPIDNFELYESELRRIFEDYIRKPFPEIVLWEDKTKINQYIRELVIEKIIKTDIPETFEHVNISLLSALKDLFMKDVGTILDVTALSKEFGVHKLTLAEHIAFLEFGNLITVVKNFRPSIRAESRKLKKVYPANIALSLCYYPKLTEGKIFESLVNSALHLDKYWKAGEKEIDFLKLDDEILPIEVKEKETINKKDIAALLYFMKKFEVSKGVVVYNGKEETIEINKRKIILLPIHKLLFNFSLE
ncbi:MAG: ATP-binding protein [Candidatus Aenigmatarchaeota archaeon]